MRVEYVPLSVSDFDKLFQGHSASRRGSGLSDIRPYYAEGFHPRGGGLLSILGSLARRSIPFLRRYILPAAATMSKDIIDDYSQGQNLRQSIKKRGIDAVKSVGKKIMTGGRKRTKTRRKRRVAKKKTTKKTIKKSARKKTKCRGGNYHVPALD